MKTKHFLIMAIMLLIFAACGRNNYLTARVMTIFRTDGETVTMNRGDGTVSANAGMRLSEGNIVSTGAASFCLISLDNDSVVKMDEHSRIYVERLSDRHLMMDVMRGQVLVDVRNQDPEHILETRIGAVVIGVRGTLFVAGHVAGGEARIAVFEGAVDVNGVLLPAGYMMIVYDGIVMEYEIMPIVFEELDDFTRNAVSDRRETFVWPPPLEYEYENELLMPEDAPPIQANVPPVQEDAPAVQANAPPVQEDAPPVPPSPPDEPPPTGVAYIYIQGERFSTTLTWLSLSFLGLTNADIEPLRYMTNLQTLELSENNISDLSPLAGLTALNSLFLGGNNISDLSPLAGLTALNCLELSWNNNITDLSPLHNLTALDSLRLSGNNITDLSPLHNLTALDSLKLRGNNITDLSPLAGLTALNLLDLSWNNNITDLSPLAGLTALQALWLGINNISDLSPLAGLTALNSLSLQYNNVSDLSPLAGLTALNSLSLSGNNITDWTPTDHVIFRGGIVDGRP